MVIPIENFQEDRALVPVYGSRDVWLLKGSEDINLFKVQASLRLDKDDDMPDAFWQMAEVGCIGVRRMKDENYRDLLMPLSRNGPDFCVFDNNKWTKFDETRVC